MISDYEDDDHFCIKCHITIAGLENYIQHRKANCAKTIALASKSPLPSQLLPSDESFDLKADDFFSSLELQSSSKKQQPLPSTSGKAVGGILTRSKTSAAIHATTSSGANVISAETDAQPSKSGKHAWIGGHQLKELGTGDNQTRLIKAVDNLSRTAYLKKYEPPSETAMVSGTYNEASDEDSDEYDYDDEDDDEEEVPRNYTGGKWMPEWSYSNVPSINHTGGKWKPSKVTSQSHSKGRPPGSSHEANVPPPNYTRGKWKPSNLKDSDQQEQQFSLAGPSKIKCGSDQLDEPKIKRQTIEDVPPFRKSNGSIQYWCNPCNRLLSSKIVYERHLHSDLHSKRALREAEFDSTATTASATSGRTAVKPMAAGATTSATHLNTSLDKEAQGTIGEPVEYWSHTGTPSENNKGPMKNTADAIAVAADDVAESAESAESATSVTTSNASVTTTAATATSSTPITMTMAASHRILAEALAATKKRIRRKIYVKCEVCLARVTLQMMGKHLISHYHCRKGDITCPEAKLMVLNNIHAIVREAPYQCGACKFYCNTHDYFLRHWRSSEHAEQVQQNGGILMCTYCKFTSTVEQNCAMYIHLNSADHAEVLCVINRSVPIIIQNLFPIKCGTCEETFSLNIQLRQHCLKTNHQLTITSKDEYQQKKICKICNIVLHSDIALQRHYLKMHNTKMYFCKRCDVEFSTIEEITKHRSTSDHKNKGKVVYKTCDYCDIEVIFESIQELKMHIELYHPEHTYVCQKCGRQFVFSQELTVHTRNDDCATVTNEEDNHNTNRCNLCTFSCNSVSELLFHQALHEPGVHTETSKRPLYKCSLCDKYFPKHSLKYHIQNHTNEKFYKCSLCGARFSRKNNWIYHMKKHGFRSNIRKIKTKRVIKEKKPLLCSICGACFCNKATLKKHMVIHNGKQYKCDHPGCIHMARTPADLNVHRSTHSTEMSFRCSRCDYHGKSKQQLKRHETVHEYVKKFQCSHCSFTCRFAFHLRRHERIHTGVKPFACPHCEYRCNNLENLRKHVLSTNKHPGKCLYECKFCEADDQFAGNFAKEFKAHLLAEHGEVFGSVTKAASYIAGIYDTIEDIASAARTVKPTSSTSEMPVASTSTAGVLRKRDKINPSILDAGNETETPAPTLIPPVENTFENKAHHQEELFPMYIIAKDDTVYLDKESWCMVGNYDVGESGSLVSFQEEPDGEPLFQEHFP